MYNSLYKKRRKNKSLNGETRMRLKSRKILLRGSLFSFKIGKLCATFKMRTRIIPSMTRPSRCTSSLASSPSGSLILRLTPTTPTRCGLFNSILCPRWTPKSRNPPPASRCPKVMVASSQSSQWFRMRSFSLKSNTTIIITIMTLKVRILRLPNRLLLLGSRGLIIMVFLGTSLTRRSRRGSVAPSKDSLTLIRPRKPDTYSSQGSPSKSLLTNM